MSYSFTEKKRIRNNFGKSTEVLEVPYLLATQINSYAGFLQSGVSPEKRVDNGLHAAFSSVFPIESHSGYAVLEYVKYRLGEPTFDVRECQQRGATTASLLKYGWWLCHRPFTVCNKYTVEIIHDEKVWKRYVLLFYRKKAYSK